MIPHFLVDIKKQIQKTYKSSVPVQMSYHLCRDAAFDVKQKLGQPDSNRRMQESKSCALPLGDGPITCNQIPRSSTTGYRDN